MLDVRMVHDGTRTWVATSSTFLDEDAVAYALTFPNGAPEVTPLTFASASQRPIDLTLARTPFGVTGSYARSGSAPLLRRVYLRPVVLDVKGRAVRH